MEKIAHQYVIQCFHLTGTSPSNIKAELDSTLGDSAPSFTTIKYWVAVAEAARTAKTNIALVDQMRCLRQKW